MGASSSSSLSYEDVFGALYREMRSIARSRPFPDVPARDFLARARMEAAVPELKAQDCADSFRKPVFSPDTKEKVDAFRSRFFTLLEARVGIEVAKAKLPGFVKTLGMGEDVLCTEKVTRMRRGWPADGKSANPFLQVLMSITSASLSACFTHNDLHLNNVLLQNTSGRTRHVYTMRYPYPDKKNNDVTYSFVDNGIRAQICDFGCSGIVAGGRLYTARRHPVLRGQRCSPVHDILYFMARADLASPSSSARFPVQDILGALGFLGPSLRALYTTYRSAVQRMLEAPTDRKTWEAVKTAGDRVGKLVPGKKAQRAVEAILVQILGGQNRVRAKGAYGFQKYVPFLSMESQTAEEIKQRIAEVGVRPRMLRFLRGILGTASLDEYLATRPSGDQQTLTAGGGASTVLYKESNIIVKRFTNQRLGLHETLVTLVVQKMANELYTNGDAAVEHFMTYLGWTMKEEALELRLLRIGKPLKDVWGRIRTAESARSVICQVLLAIMTAHLSPEKFSHLDLHFGNVTIQARGDSWWPASKERNYKALGIRVWGSEIERMRAVIIDYGMVSVNWKGIRYGHGEFDPGVVNSQSTDYAIDFFRFLFMLSLQDKDSPLLAMEARRFLYMWIGLQAAAIKKTIMKERRTVPGENKTLISYTRFISEWRKEHPEDKETDESKRALCRRFAAYAWGPSRLDRQEGKQRKKRMPRAEPAPSPSPQEQIKEPRWCKCPQILPGGQRTDVYFFEAGEKVPLSPTYHRLGGRQRSLRGQARQRS